MENNNQFSPSHHGLEKIILLCRSGDRSAFKELMESHYSFTYGVAFKILHDEQKTKDVIQETFVRVWKNITSYNLNMKFTTWLYKIIVNLCYDRLKMESRKKKYSINFNQIENEQTISTAPNFDTDLEKKDLTEMIIEIAQTLPPKQKLVFSLRDLQDCSIDEISKITGISLNSVKVNLSYARQYIRRKFEDLEK